MNPWNYYVTTLFVTTFLPHLPAVASDFSGTCTAVTAPICMRKLSGSGLQEWRYNRTTFPNFADDRSAEDVLTSLNALHPLLATSCSKFLHLYLCAVHSPVCTRHGVVPPCRELCERVRDDCRQVSETFGIRWPGGLACDSLPKMAVAAAAAPTEGLRGRKDDGFMDDSADLYVVSRSSTLMWADELVDNGKVCIPPSEEDVVGPALERLDRQGGPARQNWTSAQPADSDYGVSCPAELRAPPGRTGYNFMDLENCSAPCPNMYLGRQETSALRGFVCALAAICMMVTLFALLTFAIDRERFRYPERPIVFYAFAYFVVSVVFLIGFILGEQAPCNDKVVNVDNEIVQGYAVVVGSHRRVCTVLFMVLYYFTVNGAIWWLILTITWLLAAGFTWGSEAIEKYWLHYHTVAWTLPAVQTMIVIISNKIEGDNVAGVCFVGIHDSDGLRFLLLAPMCLYLIVGITLLLTGFLCLNRVRKILEGDAENRKKLAKFMLRIGVFSVLFIIPQISLIIIYAVEDMNRKRWEASWYVRSCDKYAVPCPAPTDPVGKLAYGDPKPHVMLFVVKYTMMLIVALPPLFWVASKKTLDSWKNFFSDVGTSKNSSLNTTQTRLLNDSNGPHAKDRDAKLMMEKASKDGEVVFGEFRDSGLHGSSASVAAAAIASRSAYERQARWDDLTDTEYTSETTSSLSRAIEYDIRRNRGERVHGRRRQQPAGRAAKDSRTEGYVIRPGVKAQARTRPPNGSAKGDFCRQKVAVEVESNSKHADSIASVKTPLGTSTPAHTVDMREASAQQSLQLKKQLTIPTNPTQSATKPSVSPIPSKNSERPMGVALSDGATPTPITQYLEADTLPLPEPVAKAIRNAVPTKPRTPPPLPPPRVESAPTKENSESALSL